MFNTFIEKLNTIINVSNDILWTYVLIAPLILLGLYFTFKTRFVQFRYIKEMFRLLTDGATSKKEKDQFHHSRPFVLVQHQELVLVI